MTRTLLLALATLAFSGCKTSDPPPVECPTSAGDPVALCSIAKADLVVEAAVQAWTSEGSRVLDLEGFPDTVMTPAALDVKRVLRGTAFPGRLDVMIVGCIAKDGTSVQGPLQVGESKSEGYFYVVRADGYNVLVPQGFFRREAGLLKNAGEAAEGIPEADFFGKMSCGAADAGL